MWRHICRGVCAATVALLTACGAVKHVPQGQYLLDNVKIEVEGEPEGVTRTELATYLRQQPNHRVLGFWKLQLNTYSLSGHDSTRWYNRWLRRLGQAPVIWSDELTDASARQLRLALERKGYLNASVAWDTIAGHRRLDVAYAVTPGEPYRISDVRYEVGDSAVAQLLAPDTTLLRPGMLLDYDRLDAARAAITERLRNNGYRNFARNNIRYTADTVARSRRVALTMHVLADSTDAAAAVPYRVGRVVFVTDYRLGQTMEEVRRQSTDTLRRGGYEIVYDADRWVTPGTLTDKCYIEPGGMYRAGDIDRTYENLSRLAMVRSVNIESVEVSPGVVDTYILLTRNRKQDITLDVEGTNSEGDLGFGVGLTYRHRNLGHRSRVLTAKFRASYESLSGNLEGLINNNYQEYAGEVGITFPHFAMPFLSGAYKRSVKATTEVALSFNYQERPEYTRIIGGGAWRYRWGDARNLTRRTLDLLNINYVRLPRSTIDFLDQIAPDNPLLRYSYEDHFITSTGYSLYHTNRRQEGPSWSAPRLQAPVQPLIYTLRASVEAAGNLMYLLSTVVGQHRHGGVYKVFGIQYSQYVKAEVDYALVRNLNSRHSLAFRVGAGVGVPYGNSRALPFEKRFYAGGANGVRGWSVRTLGPGRFDGRNSVTDFINQCGDISLLLSAEYRAKLFWVIEGALFVDAGNIWTIRSYPNQRGGVFRPGEFLGQLAASYGAGLRFDFSYFLLRLDLGLKAHNPAEGQEPWPLIHPRWHRDATFHFAVGYPF